MPAIGRDPSDAIGIRRLKVTDRRSTASVPLLPFDFLDSGLSYRLEQRINVSPKLARVRSEDWAQGALRGK
jgi:hypothetical protein